MNVQMTSILGAKHLNSIKLRVMEIIETGDHPQIILEGPSK